MNPVVLLTEENDLLRWSVASALSDSSEVVSVGTVEEALSRLRQGTVDVLLVGCRFDGCDCGDLARKARASSPGVRIVLMRENAERLSDCENCSAPCDLVLVKPIDLSALKSELDRLVQG